MGNSLLAVRVINHKYIVVGKEYLDLLPLSKWTDETVRGKILQDIVSMTGLLMLRKSMTGSGLSISEVFGKCQSLMCFRNNQGMITVETPCKQVKTYYKLFNAGIPAHVKLGDLRDRIHLKM